ncbi:MAG: dTDP-4-dehydrorhamnose 3,5-epimerase [Planctomycetota bacterium]
MSFESTEIPDVRVYRPARHGDERGYFSETWSRAAFRAGGVDIDFVQDNHSLSRSRGVLRGLHFQIAPFAQDKLVRVVRGAVLDVAVDIRRDSPTFGRHVARELSAENGAQLLVPVGFAHGFVTLVEDTEVLYKVSAPYSRESERGLRWDDPALGIDWRTEPGAITINDRDRGFPLLSELRDLF